MNLCVYVFIILSIDNFVNKFIENYQNRSNLPFGTFGVLKRCRTFKMPAGVMPCGKLARFPSIDVT